MILRSSSIFLLFCVTYFVSTEADEECKQILLSGDYNGTNSGEISSPNYPDPYPSSTACVYELRAAVEESVWIEWTDFDLEGPFRSTDAYCYDDFVVIVLHERSGRNESKRYCGYEKPPDLKTDLRNVDIIFQSSKTNNYKGFHAIYKFMKPEGLHPKKSTLRGEKDPESQGCGGVVMVEEGEEEVRELLGVLVSPGYPETFPPHADCRWTLQVTPGNRIRIRITNLNISPSDYVCEVAKMQVVEGSAEHTPRGLSLVEEELRERGELVEWCGEERHYYHDELSHVSQTNMVIVRFVSLRKPKRATLDRRKEYSKSVGFRLVWEEVASKAQRFGLYGISSLLFLASNLFTSVFI